MVLCQNKTKVGLKVLTQHNNRVRRHGQNKTKVGLKVNQIFNFCLCRGCQNKTKVGLKAKLVYGGLLRMKVRIRLR